MERGPLLDGDAPREHGARNAPRDHEPLLDRNALPARTWTVTGWRCPLPPEWKLKNVFWKGVRLFNKTKNLWNGFKFQMSLLLLTSCRCPRKGHEPTSPCTLSVTRYLDKNILSQANNDYWEKVDEWTLGQTTFQKSLPIHAKSCYLHC